MKRKTTGQKRPKTTRTSYVSLPKELVNDIKSLNITKTQISHCIKFVGILYRDCIDDYDDATHPTPKPQKYLVKTFDDKYYIWLNVLINNEIVIRSDNYSHIEHLCYSYSVNPKYLLNLSTSIETNSFNVLCKEKYSEPLCTVGYKDIVKIDNIEDLKYRNWFIKDMDTLILDYNLLEDIVCKRLDELDIDDFIIDEEILPSSIKLRYNDGKELFQNSKVVLSGITGNYKLIKDKDIFKIVNPSSFLANKRATMNIYYTNSLERLKNKSFGPKRNTTNKRLDSNLTNMASVLVDEICRQNDLVQIDLSNSQFALLTNELDKHLDTSDFKSFKELTSTGNLYRFIANNLGLKTEKNGKQLMFEVLFSKHRNNSIFKKKIKELFPSVVGWIDQYKKEHGDSNFSIMLQLKESDLFIDKILKRIKKQNYLCFTKHDSVIVRSENCEKVIEIIQDEFAKIKLDYRLKVTTPSSEYFVYNKDHNPEELIKQEEMRKSYSGYFRYSSPTTTLKPAEFHNLTNRKYVETITLTAICSMVHKYDKNGFDIFWNDVQNLTRL